MKIVLVISALAFYVTLTSAQNCTSGSWGGATCLNACGKCANDDVCDAVTGNCPGGCEYGYQGVKCDQAVCKQDCGPGICVAPDICGACGDINLVSPNCEDIRLKGLLGSLLALGVVSISITLCGIGSVYYKRSRNTPVAL